MSVTFSGWKFINEIESISSPEDLDINMNNRNAALVSESLGIDLNTEGWCGSTTAEDFLGRVLMALAITPADEGMPSYEVPGTGARMIEGARNPGYVQERLGQLHTLALWAVENDAEITWG